MVGHSALTWGEGHYRKLLPNTDASCRGVVRYEVDIIWSACYVFRVATIEYHSEFAQQFDALQTSSVDIYRDVAALVTSLVKHGHLMEGSDHTDDLSHPIVTSPFDMWALRRTPPTVATPNATDPPVLRIPYVWMSDAAGADYALVLFIGDKTQLRGDWYPTALKRIDADLLPRWLGTHAGHSPRNKRRAQ
jgi:hypothetical protein